MKVNENGEKFERLKNEKSITTLFKNLISFNMITLIAFYTNKRIANINTKSISQINHWYIFPILQRQLCRVKDTSSFLSI
jgi:hypothetical protein